MLAENQSTPCRHARTQASTAKGEWAVTGGGKALHTQEAGMHAHTTPALTFCTPCAVRGVWKRKHTSPAADRRGGMREADRQGPRPTHLEAVLAGGKALEEVLHQAVKV